MIKIFTILFLAVLPMQFAFAAKAKEKKENLKAEVVGHDSDEEGHHDHEKKSDDKEHKEHAKAPHDDHDEKENDDHDDHAEEGHEGHDESAEENPQVGEGKGITAATPEQGFKLSEQATKNFEIETVKVESNQSIIIPKMAIVTAGDEVNIFRLRDGFYKRIDFDTIKKDSKQVTIKSKDLKVSDQIVVHGNGFLRIAEIAAFGGAPEGHSH